MVRTTQFLEDEIVALTQYIWSTTVDLEPLPDLEAEAAPTGGRTLDGVINITGGWAGAVVLQVPEPVGRLAAAAMFQLDPASASLADMQDAVAELTNMTGGNIKALFDAPCALSLPTVVEGTNYSIRVPGSEAITRVVFEVAGAAVVVSLLARRTAT